MIREKTKILNNFVLEF